MRDKKPELLVPAGGLDTLKVAVDYGADAVYIGGQAFGLRAKADNFSIEEMKQGVEYAHAHNAKVYVTANIFAHNYDLDGIRAYFGELKDTGVDAVLVSDPGVFTIARETMPDMELHISTQANNTNYMTYKFWYDHGIKRVVSARELSLAEISQIRANIPDDMEIESFIHGAMCISYSGRCLLSNYFTGRDANHGACTHPCRWKYSVMEEQRPGEYFPIEEDDRGSYIMNSRDLCMLDCLPDMINAGVTSLKIEGRMKSAYYVATVVSAYRAALDSYMKDPENYEFKQEWYDELCKASHREFTHGFFYQKPSSRDQNYLTSDYVREYSFIGVVLGVDEATGETIVQQRNKFCVGDEIEIMSPGEPFYTEEVPSMKDEDGNAIESAPHPKQEVRIPFRKVPAKYSILRKRK